MSTELITPQGTPADYELGEAARRVACLQRPGELEPPRGVVWPWWLFFPLNGRYFTKNNAITTPALGTNLAVVLSFTVPPGWDGVIRKLFWTYSGPGFVPGSGDLQFFIRRAGAMIDDYIGVTFLFQEVRDTYIIVRETQLIELLVSVSAAALIPIAGTFILGSMDGWFSPRGNR